MAVSNIQPTVNYRLPLDAVSNCNDAYINGESALFKFTSNSNNRPAGSGSILASANDDGTYVTQIALVDGGTNASYIRTKSNGTWGSWIVLATKTYADSAAAAVKSSVATLLGSLTDKTVSSGTNTELGAITLPSAGGYIVTATGIFAANSTGDRAMWFAASSGAGAYNANVSTYQRATASTSDKQRLQIIGIFTVNALTDIHLVVKQTSGGNMTVQSRYSIVKLY